MKTLDFETCMDVFDWFNDDLFDYLHHILVSKVLGEARIAAAMPFIRERAWLLIRAHRGTELAYPFDVKLDPA